MVVALHSGGTNIAESDATLKHVFAYGVGIDLTRRDHQGGGEGQGQPVGRRESVRPLRRRHRRCAARARLAIPTMRLCRSR